MTTHQALCRYERQRTASERWSVLRPLGHAEFAATPRSAATVRTWARHLLHTRIPDTALDDVVLLLSEVVTNSIVHSDSGHTPTGSVTVCLGLGGNLVHAEVIDDGSATSLPFIRATDLDSDGGRGLLLVEAMATAWGTHHDPEAGTAVWFRLPAHETNSPDEAGNADTPGSSSN